MGKTMYGFFLPPLLEDPGQWRPLFERTLFITMTNKSSLVRETQGVAYTM